MKTKFLSVCLGISAVLFSAGFMIQSLTPATAQSNIIDNNNKIGKYQVALSYCKNANSTGDCIAIICDTETGTSRTYTAQWGDSRGWSQSSGAWDLPDQ